MEGVRTAEEALADRDWREFAGTFSWPDGGSVADGSSGWEWQGAQPGQGATELGFPRPALGQMQGESG